MASGAAPEVAIWEVGPRDGLQNESELVPREAKIELVTRLAEAGLRNVEVTSFVSPEWIPQLADADEVAQGVPQRPGVRYGALVRELLALGADEISLGDPIGVGTPPQVRRLVRAVAEVAPLSRVALHLHDTYGRALANVQAGYEEGVRSFDASLGGLGGCPYAPGASGNVATEDVVDLFEAEGVDTGIDEERLVEATAWVERELLGRPLPGPVFRARLGARERGGAS